MYLQVLPVAPVRTVGDRGEHGWWVVGVGVVFELSNVLPLQSCKHGRCMWQARSVIVRFATFVRRSRKVVFSFVLTPGEAPFTATTEAEACREDGARPPSDEDVRFMSLFNAASSSGQAMVSEAETLQVVQASPFHGRGEMDLTRRS